MGVYDNFQVLNYYHSVCGHNFTEYWQTNSLMQILENYNIGDDIRRPDYLDALFDDYKHAVFEIHTYCPKCEQMLSEYGRIEDFIYTGLYRGDKKFDKCPWCQQKL